MLNTFNLLKELKVLHDINCEIGTGQYVNKKKEQILQNSSFLTDSEVYQEIVTAIINQFNVIIVPTLPKGETLTIRVFGTFASLFRLCVEHPEWTFYIHSLNVSATGNKVVELYVEGKNGEEIKIF